MTDGTQVFYDEKGAPLLVQMSVGDYEKLIAQAKDAVAAKDAIKRALESLKG
jgi:hypothetical protein